ncbi:hypothetical protein I6E74_05200 [Salinibacterium sp. SWN139]|uniref:hypothetical protein n=1 Tax=Salinibacterium sp. SWN139 TaxID=2792055 RepID=UPI0018CD5091|nr:hypothetical protein [Salinibacterium sp. SWN139]MBH0053568.1 hypothetical protein [Salinibacterium sp. SWN139]
MTLEFIPAFEPVVGTEVVVPSSTVVASQVPFALAHLSLGEEDLERSMDAGAEYVTAGA